jgi:dipeptidyl aminopeptidase/acylaminoacyl peptidase
MLRDVLGLFLSCLLLSGLQASLAAEAPAKLPLPTLDDLFSTQTVPDMAISPSGRYVAAVLRNGDLDYLVVTDLQTGERRIIVKIDKKSVGKNTEASLIAVYWKSDERLLLRSSVSVEEGVSYSAVSDRSYLKLGTRLVAINRDGSNLVRLLADNRNSALEGAFNLGAIASWLPGDQNHIVMTVDGDYGPALFRVDLTSGLGELIERPSESVIGWWLDLQGMPMVRVQWLFGALVLSRKNDEGKWKKFYVVRRKDMKNLPEYEAVGSSDQPDKYYVLARPEGRDRVGLYLYDLKNETFGQPIIENPRFDLMSAQVSRDGKRIVRSCYIAHVRICDFSDPKINAHMKGVRKYFADSANAYVYDSSDDGKVIVFFVEGPGLAPTYYYYLTDKAKISILGYEREQLAQKTLPSAAVVSWKARDGLDLTGYLTIPSSAADAKSLPLVVMPHGGPEDRDRMTFDRTVQYLATRGYVVFQPNFRGSDGFGKAFAESGYGEWGRRMQDDITDGLKDLIAKGVVDPARVCIVGASYGGYAALAGVALTPDLYRCAVATAAISDLEEFVKSRKRKFGTDSETYKYWLQAIGDPKVAEDKLAAASPARLAASIRAPVLLVHGTVDDVVPYAQSELMKRALDKAGKPTELISLKGEDHSYWSDYNEKAWLIAIDRFLWQHLGPGFGVSNPPLPMPKLNQKK